MVDRVNAGSRALAYLSASVAADRYTAERNHAAEAERRSIRQSLKETGIPVGYTPRISRRGLTGKVRTYPPAE